MYPPEVITALKDALKNIYWYKDDLRLFLLALDLPAGLVAKQGWHDDREYKVRIAGKVLNELVELGEDGLGPMRRLIRAVLEIPNFDHLQNLDDGPAKVQAGRRSVEKLRDLVVGHDSELERVQREDSPIAAQVADALRRRNDEIEGLHQRFLELITVDDHQRRGLLFEGFLRDLFAAHDMDPRGSFRIVGEQIDGGFEFEGTQFLLEARWRKERQGAAPLDAFARKVERKLENTLGLFISLEGFTEDGISAFRRSRPAVILSDGEDLAIVLQGLVDFRDLLKRKVRHAAHTGDPYLRARDIGL
jgi:hypothetical protein